MSKPLFEQIYETYKKRILIGIYKQGDKLPSVREVGEKLGVNPHTVNRAYSLLEKDGYVETVFKKGSFVKTVDLVDPITSEFEKELLKYKNNGLTKIKAYEIIKKVYGDIND